MERAGPCLLLLFAAALAGCGSEPGSPDAGVGPTFSDMTGPTWQLVEMTHAGSSQAITKEVAITLRVEPNGRVQGRSAVNRYVAQMERDSQGRLSLTSGGAIASTRMAGPPDHMALETAYLATLNAVRTAALTEKGLTLTNDDGSETLVFRKGE